MCKRLAIVVMLALLSSYAFSDNLYRYKNDVGGTVVDWHVPLSLRTAGTKGLTRRAKSLRSYPVNLVKANYRTKT